MWFQQFGKIKVSAGIALTLATAWIINDGQRRAPAGYDTAVPVAALAERAYFYTGNPEFTNIVIPRAGDAAWRASVVAMCDALSKPASGYSGRGSVWISDDGVDPFSQHARGGPMDEFNSSRAPTVSEPTPFYTIYDWGYQNSTWSGTLRPPFISVDTLKRGSSIPEDLSLGSAWGAYAGANKVAFPKGFSVRSGAFPETDVSGTDNGSNTFLQACWITNSTQGIFCERNRNWDTNWMFRARAVAASLNRMVGYFGSGDTGFMCVATATAVETNGADAFETAVSDASYAITYTPSDLSQKSPGDMSVYMSASLDSRRRTDYDVVEAWNGHDPELCMIPAWLDQFLIEEWWGWSAEQVLAYVHTGYVENSFEWIYPGGGAHFYEARTRYFSTATVSYQWPWFPEIKAVPRLYQSRGVTNIDAEVVCLTGAGETSFGGNLPYGHLTMIEHVMSPDLSGWPGESISESHASVPVGGDDDKNIIDWFDTSLFGANLGDPGGLTEADSYPFRMQTCRPNYTDDGIRGLSYANFRSHLSPMRITDGFPIVIGQPELPSISPPEAYLIVTNTFLFNSSGEAYCTYEDAGGVHPLANGVDLFPGFETWIQANKPGGEIAYPCGCLGVGTHDQVSQQWERYYRINLSALYFSVMSPYFEFLGPDDHYGNDR